MVDRTGSAGKDEGDTSGTPPMLGSHAVDLTRLRALNGRLDMIAEEWQPQERPVQPLFDAAKSLEDVPGRRVVETLASTMAGTHSNIQFLMTSLAVALEGLDFYAGGNEDAGAAARETLARLEIWPRVLVRDAKSETSGT